MVVLTARAAAPGCSLQQLLLQQQQQAAHCLSCLWRLCLPTTVWWSLSRQTAADRSLPNEHTIQLFGGLSALPGQSEVFSNQTAAPVLTQRTHKGQQQTLDDEQPAGLRPNAALEWLQDGWRHTHANIFMYKQTQVPHTACVCRHMATHILLRGH
jgi:hypothetical protein